MLRHPSVDVTIESAVGGDAAGESSDDSAISTPPETRASSRRTIIRLVGFAIGVALVRWLLAISHRTFHIYFDEPAQLAAARTVAGGAPWRLFDTPIWQSGYGILLAPLYVVVDDPTTIYRLAIVVNALLGGLSFVLLVLIARELTGRALSACIGPALVVSVAPAAIVASAFVWSEQLLIVLALATMLATMRFVREPRMWTGLSAIGLGALGYLTHGRLMAIMAIATAIVIGCFVHARRWRDALISIVGAVSSLVVVVAISSLIRDRLWTTPQGGNSVRATLSRLQDPLAVLDALIGQVWYVLVASLGFAAFGALAIRQSFATRERRAAAIVLSVFVLSTVAISALFMSGRSARTDMLIYGRYIEAVIGPLLVIGWFELRRRIERFRRSDLAWFAAVATLTLTLAVAIHVLHGSELQEGQPFLVMIPALAALDAEPGTRTVIPTIVALLAAFVIIAAARITGTGSKAFIATVALITCVGIARTGAEVTLVPQTVLSSEDLDEMAAQVPAGEVVELRVIPSNQSLLYSPAKQRTRLQLYQFQFPELSFTIDNGTAGAEPSSNYVLAPELTTALVESDATILWDDPNSPMALWYVP